MGKAIVVPGADYRERNLGSVTPSDTLHIEEISIVGSSNVFMYEKYTAILSPTFTTDRNVVWSIVSGSEFATISQNGTLSGIIGAMNESVTIRCSSQAYPNVYAEKTVTVTAGNVTYYDWITSDGTDYVVTSGLNDIWNAQAVLRCTLGSANTYTFMCFYASNSSQARLAAYNNASNKASAYTGTGGTNNWVNKSDIVYRYEWNCGTSGGTDSTAYLYNDATNQQLGSKTSTRITISGLFWIFEYGYGEAGTDPGPRPVALTPSGSKFYRFTVTKGGNTLCDLRPCLWGNKSGVIDDVTHIFYGGNLDTGGLSVGND